MYWKGLSSLLIIFGRYPIPGRVKTRLIPHLGPVGSTNLQKRLTEEILKEVRKVSSISDIAFFYKGGSKRLLRRWLGKDIIFIPQSDNDLGRSMRDAIEWGIRRGYEKVVLIGTDIYGLRGEYIEEAFRRLERYELVIGPSEDGGYWLIGMNGLIEEIFSGIDWGTDKVLDQTISTARKRRINFFLLNRLMDIDTIEDVKKAKIEIRPFLSVIIPTLNEEENIRDSIISARCPDSEIIVVDGGSRDRTLDIAEELGVRIIKTERGRGIQQNIGAREARGEVLVFLHADTRLPRGYSYDIFHEMMDKELLVGSFLFKTDMDHPIMRLIEVVANMRARFFCLPYGDQAFFIKKEKFKEIGGFPIVPIAEDLYFIHKASKLGKVKVVPKAAITSSRKWKRYGIFKTTLFHWKILFGFLLKTWTHFMQ